jgi:hypothetical protein
MKQHFDLSLMMYSAHRLLRSMANLEHLIRLKEGVAARNQSGNEDRDSAPNLREADLGATRVGLHAIQRQKTQLMAQRTAKRPSLHRLLVIVSLSIAVLLIFAPTLQAQYVDSGTWFGGYATGKLPRSMNNANGSWRVWMDGQLRFGDDSSRFSQGLVRPGIGYSLNKAWSLWAGYAYVRTDQPYALKPSTENRIWEQVNWQHLVGSTDLSSRTRLEQRFNSAGTGTGVRLREMGKLIQPLGAKKIWLVAMSDEMFVNLNSTNFGARSGADRNRAFIGPGINLGRTIRTEVGYMNQYIFNNNGPDRVDNIFSVNAFWNFSHSAPPEE